MRVRHLQSEWRTIQSGVTLRDRLRIVRVFLHAHLHLGRGRRLFAGLPQGRMDERSIRFKSGLDLLVRPEDAVVLWEHVGADVYGVQLGLDDVRTIVDLGANIGYATLALAARYPGARMVCVEPAAATRELLRRNLERNGVTAEICDVAVVGTPGAVSIAPGDFAAVNRVEADSEGTIEGVSMGVLLDRLGIEHVELLKIDIEGAEREVFEHAGGWADRVDAIVGELHGDFTEPQAEHLLSPYGFRRLPLPHGDVTAFVKSG